jgi:hypothetical protein
VEIEDFGATLTGTSGSTSADGAELAAVELSSCPDWRIDNLMVRQTGAYEELQTSLGAAATDGPIALKIGKDPDYATGSTGGIGLRMKCYNVYQPILEYGAGTGSNAFNMTVNFANRSAATIGSTIAPGSLYQGRLLTQSVTTDVGNIPAGQRLTFSMGLTGIKPGDMIEGWSSSLSPQGLVINPQVTGDDTITVYLHNVHTAAIDVPSMTYTVHVRLSRP